MNIFAKLASAKLETSLPPWPSNTPNKDAVSPLGKLISVVMWASSYEHLHPYIEHAPHLHWLVVPSVGFFSSIGLSK